MGTAGGAGGQRALGAQRTWLRYAAAGGSALGAPSYALAEVSALWNLRDLRPLELELVSQKFVLLFS